MTTTETETKTATATITYVLLVLNMEANVDRISEYELISFFLFEYTFCVSVILCAEVNAIRFEWIDDDGRLV